MNAKRRVALTSLASTLRSIRRNAVDLIRSIDEALAALSEEDEKTKGDATTP